EVSSVDGYVGHYQSEASWATIRNGAGTDANDTDWNGIKMYITGALPTYWVRLYRPIILFDTSGLPDDAIKTSATLSIDGAGKVDNLSISPFSLNIYSSNPASNIVLEAADYITLGAEAFCDTPITYAAWDTADYNDFVLNAAGIAAISTIGVTKLGARDTYYDVPNNSPGVPSGNTYSNIIGHAADTGSGSKPKLVVIYELAVGLENKSANMAAKMIAGKLI
ncbi:unnamed protein product, partial [marine sediment metagenome]